MFSDCKVMFRGYDEDYEHNDILNHIAMLDLDGDKMFNYFNQLIETGELKIESGTDTREYFFAKFIPDHLINNRTTLLGSLQDGLTVGGKARPSDEIEKGCGLARFYSMIPFEVIQQRFFAKPDICVDDLISVILPKYMAGGE